MTFPNLEVEDLTSAGAGTYVITVDARGDIPTIKVEKISDFAEIGKVTGITINSTSHKVSYNAGESLDVSGLTIEVTKEDVTTKTVKVSSSMVSGFNSLELGTQTLTITYGGCTTTFDIEVIEE